MRAARSRGLLPHGLLVLIAEQGLEEEDLALVYRDVFIVINCF